ncbi:LOW QUALITY PROTEIN: centrosomal protein of 295 kDa [Sphaerodactylus townsendi]|uniref:LOW QUALITY PROTEIN: centrosomal protein of 295 kDa n=1 Tax=Sphaerodactylus townsendi TaxID=933632 RepID=UPI002026DB70|nr:LOW QUALITY PROTEIN: centrosomal protein of 295 kDa [Sphaerodactylus townsendi]
MKRKVAKAGKMRLSPNEEALLLKEEYERRRKLRLQQVREQEKSIALQIRQDVKQRRDEQLHQLAEELKAEWWQAQAEKIKALEKLYLASLNAIGEGHRQAKENKPDPEAEAKHRERKQRAERRHKEALREQRSQKQKLLKEQTRRATARKHALEVEKERAAKIASLPPPPPDPFENIELKSVPTMKVYGGDSFAVSHHHFFEPHVDREMDNEQPDARLLAEKEAKRQEGLQSKEEREKREQSEKAHLRGMQALKMVRLARDREKLMQELEQMQNMDLAHRRQIVAQMPPQLFEPGYRREEIREERQRELECAFEDMYTGDRKMRGDLILHLDPQPLPTFSNHSQDTELDLSHEPGDFPSEQGDAQDTEPAVEIEKAPKTHAKLALKKLLSKIRNQKDHWTSRCEPAAPSDTETIESGTISSRERRVCESELEDEPNDGWVSEAEEVPEVLNQTVVAGNAVVSHSQEQPNNIGRKAERQKQMEQLEHQKQQQLALLQQLEEQRIQLEVDLLRSQMQDLEGEVKKQPGQTIQMNDKDLAVNQQQETELKFETATGMEMTSSSGEDDHIRMIRDYQQRLLVQSRMHKESVDEARKRLQEYQNRLKQRYPSVSATLFGPATEGLARPNPVPAPSLLLHGSDASQNAGRAGHLPSKHTSVQEFAQPVGYSQLPWRLKGPSGQKDTEQRFDVGSQEHIRTTEAQVEQRPLESFQDSGPVQETVGIPVTQGLEFQGIPEASILKTQDTAAKAHPAWQVQFTLPTGAPLGASQTFHPYKPGTCAAPAEDTHLPSFLKPVPTERGVTFDAIHRPPVQLLPSSTAGEAGRLQELNNGSRSFSGYSDIVELRDRMLASSESIQAQQEHLKELQDQLDQQREALLSRQRVQEDLLMHKHAQLKKQMEQQQEALKAFLQQAGQSTYGEAQDPPRVSLLATRTKEADSGNRGKAEWGPAGSPAENKLLFPSTDSSERIELFQSTREREPTWRPSKPPLAKVKLGLDLEQHELSAIPELDTPRSSRLSGTGYRESLTGDTFFTSCAGELQSSSHSDDSLHEEPDTLRMAVNDKDHSFSETIRSRLSPSWPEKWLAGASNLRDPVHSAEHFLTDQRLLSSTTDTGRQLALYPDSSLGPNHRVSHAGDLTRCGALKTNLLPLFPDEELNTARFPGPGRSSPQTRVQEAACSYLSSSSISVGSFILNEQPDGSFASTGFPSGRAHSGHVGSPAKEMASTTWNRSVSSLYKKGGASESPGSHFPFGERLHSSSRIQQIIDKYTRDLSSSPRNTSSHGPAAEVDVTNIERISPVELFQPLEASPDFDNFSPLSEHWLTHDSKNLSKSSDLSGSHELPLSSSEDRSIGLSFLAEGKQSNTLQTKKAEEETKDQIKELSSVKMDASVFQPRAENFFEPLLTSATSFELSRSADEPAYLTAVSEHAAFEQMRKSVEELMHISLTGYNEALEGGEEEVSPPSTIENFRSPSLSPVQDCSSFYQLIPNYGLLENALGTTPSAKEDAVSREENRYFVELPVASADSKHEGGEQETKVIINEDREMDCFQCASYSVGEHRSLPAETLLNSAQEANSGVSIGPVQNSAGQHGSVSDTFRFSYSGATHVKSPSSCLLQNVIPIWELQVGRGIMEEPELTLISSTDISVAGSDWEPLQQADIRTGETERLSHRSRPEAETCPGSRSFLPLKAEGNDSIYAQPDDCLSLTPSTKEDLCQNQQAKTMFSEFPSAPGSLQESFFKRKKKFIEESSKRLEKVKSRQQRSAKPQVKAPPQKTTKPHKPKENLPPSGAAASHLKKVAEVKVCSAEDRRKAGVEMHQRTSRLYNNLAEVKIRKDEKERRMIHAKNREKAKEFQKKTLEILRAKKTC